MGEGGLQNVKFTRSAKFPEESEVAESVENDLPVDGMSKERKRKTSYLLGRPK